MKVVNAITSFEQDIPLEADKINILIGKNGSGKSTILQSIYNSSGDSAIYIGKDSKISDFFFTFSKQDKISVKTPKSTLSDHLFNGMKMSAEINWDEARKSINMIDLANFTNYDFKDGKFKFSGGPGDGNEKIAIIKFLSDKLKGSKKERILLIDEPENHLHSNNLFIYIEILKKLSSYKNIKVVLSTHSEEIVKRSFLHSSLLITTRNKSEFKISKINTDYSSILRNPKFSKRFKTTSVNKNFWDMNKVYDSKRRKEFIEELSLRLPEIISKYIFSKKILIGEGSLEQSIENFVNCSVISSWGKDKMPFLIYILNDLSKKYESREITVMYDQDHKEDGTISDMHSVLNKIIQSFIDKRTNKIVKHRINFEYELTGGKHVEKGVVQTQSNAGAIMKKYVKKKPPFKKT